MVDSREITKQKLSVMQAFVEGKEIECTGNSLAWAEITNPVWNWQEFNYRVKPEQPKYRLYRYKDQTDFSCFVVTDLEKKRLETLEHQADFGKIVWITEWTDLPEEY